MQCACILLPSVACLAPNYFPLYLINGKIFEKKILNIKCVLISTFSSETFLILRRIDRDMIKSVHLSSYKVAVIFVRL